MVRRLTAAGFEVLGYNRTQAKASALRDEAGMQVAESPRQVAAETDVVMSMVSDDSALRAIALGPAGIVAGLGTGKTWVDFSTVSPRLSVELGEHAAACGSARLEAPVSGSVPAVEAGTLVILVGGDEAVVARVEPVLRHLGSIQRIGVVGQALALKLAINLSIPLQLFGFAEGLVIAERAGLDRDRVIELMLGTVLASPMLKYRIPFAQQPPQTPWFTVGMMLKDVELALDEASARGVATPMTARAADLLKLAMRRGLGEEEVAAVVSMLEALQGPVSDDPLVAQ